MGVSTTDEEDEEIAALRSYATAAGVRIKWARQADGDRLSEWNFIEDAAILGRVLYTLGQLKSEKRHEDINFL